MTTIEVPSRLFDDSEFRQFLTDLLASFSKEIAGLQDQINKLSMPIKELDASDRTTITGKLIELENKMNELEINLEKLDNQMYDKIDESDVNDRIDEKIDEFYNELSVDINRN